MPLHDWSRVDAGVFHDQHLAWIGAMRNSFNSRLLPSPFYAMAEPNIGDVQPDVLTLQYRADTSEADTRIKGLAREEPGKGMVALAPCPILVQEMGPPDPYSLKTRRIVIHEERHGDRIVAVLELVSRGNKDARSKVEEFTAKNVGLLHQGVHVLFVDVQPPTRLAPSGFHAKICEAYGTRARAAPPDRRLQAVSYEVREDRSVRAIVAPLRVGDSLPEMPLFLRPGQYIRVPLEVTYMEGFAGLATVFRAVLETPRREGAPRPLKAVRTRPPLRRSKSRAAR